MRIWRGDLRSLRFSGPTFLTIGNFDGIHLGHQALLRVLQADAVNHAPAAKTALLTFDPHPMAVLRPESSPAPVDYATGASAADRTVRL